MSTEHKAKAVHFDVDTALSATTHSRPLRKKSRIPTFSSPRAYAIVMPFDEMLARAKKENPDVQKLIDERGFRQEIAAVNLMVAKLCDKACEIWPNAFMVVVDERSFRIPLQCIGLADNTHLLIPRLLCALCNAAYHPISRIGAVAILQSQSPSSNFLARAQSWNELEDKSYPVHTVGEPLPVARPAPPSLREEDMGKYGWRFGVQNRYRIFQVHNPREELRNYLQPFNEREDFFLINLDSHGSSSPLQQNGVEFNGVDASLPSPGAESVSTGAASSDDSESDEDDDEGAEENERVDENGPIVIDDDKDTLDDDQEPPLIVKGEPSPSSAVICDSEAEKTKAAEANH
ncbi:hypothetical protein F5890DRAFT_1476738 [Lentinula detonsa]|uniref:Uncharacterized protein n=1 Tax=Lentinula detonsa TaxID=2804962 RepID=A0AA38UQJ6_9AGAR|nr:hypothetical protein F5890DRAFT_1476738 [Lentinula detonsa]